MMTSNQQDKAVIAVDGASKSFGAVRALDGVDFQVAPGECVGLVGHNGAGKSTLVSIINGGLGLDSGTISLFGEVETSYSIAKAHETGVRCVFQELSLCPNLTVIENVRIAHASLKGWGWRKRAATLIRSKLDEIFPGHGIDCRRTVGSLSIAERQVVEIAMAFTQSRQPVRMVILDEPTSSLDTSLAAQLIAYVRRFVGEGGAVVFISHILDEIIDIADRVVVMKDGKVVVDKAAETFDVAGLVQAMGSVVREQATKRVVREVNETESVIDLPETEFIAYPGEIIGLAGLGGHGQTEALVNLFMGNSGDWLSPKDPKVAFVAGDRHVDGVLPLWSILRNMSVALLPDLTKGFVVDTQKEASIAQDWRKRISIRTDNMKNLILSLSGGNQQKVLFARALATRAPVVLMDDPMRGVDIGTKQEVYAMLRAEADKGRTFVWYSTEMDEVCQCDRVYVFREGEIVAELKGDNVTEENILAASFHEAAA